MSLDKFIVSILFDDQSTKESARKIDDVVKDLKNSIIGSLAAVASSDFLKNVVKSTVDLSTKLDNLSYQTNESKQDIFAWGEAVKRTGGTAESFYSSISGLSEKLMEMQTNFGSAGQVVFMRLGINLVDVNGKMKKSTDILKELADKFVGLPKAWQFNLGKQLGLDNATIRMLSEGGKSTQDLVDRMTKLGNLSALDSEKLNKYRNSLYDISLIFTSLKIDITNALIPALKKFNEYYIVFLSFLERHSGIVKIAVVALSAVLSGALLSAILSVTRAIIAMGVAFAATPIGILILALSGLLLIIDDVRTYLRGGQSAFEEYYKVIEKYFNKMTDFFDKLNRNVRSFFGLKKDGRFFEGLFDSFDGFENKLKEKDIEDKIKEMAISLGVNPNLAVQVAKNENSNLDPNLKSDTSSASGIFQLTDKTAARYGIQDPSFKNDVDANIRAGLMNLRDITQGLSKYFNRTPTAGEVGLGERLGLEGSKKVFSAPKNTPLSIILSPEAIKANSGFETMTNSQLIDKSNKMYSTSKSVTVGQVKINAPNSNAKQISQKIAMELQNQLSLFVTSIDNGVIA